MTRTLLSVLALLVSLAACATQESADIAVPAPTGVMEQDRAAVQSVFDSVKAGQIVQFAAGRYVLGAGVRLVLVADPDRTTIRARTPEGGDWTLGIDDVLDGGDVLPGFRVPVARFFRR